MNDHIETPVETVPVEGIALSRNATVIVASLAAYGAVSLTRDVTRKAKSILANRKASKETETQSETDTPQS